MERCEILFLVFGALLLQTASYSCVLYTATDWLQWLTPESTTWKGEEKGEEWRGWTLSLCLFLVSFPLSLSPASPLSLSLETKRAYHMT
jgi:hypothetical protein